MSPIELLFYIGNGTAYLAVGTWIGGVWGMIGGMLS